MSDLIRVILWQGGITAGFMLIFGLLFAAPTIASRFSSDLPIIGMIAIFAAWAVVSAVVGIFQNSWFSYVLASAGLGLALLVWGIVLNSVLHADAFAKAGPAAMAYMLPILIFCGCHPLGGLVRLAVAALRSVGK